MQNNRGLTLTELLVSTFLVGIIMSTVVVFTTSVKNVENSTKNILLLQLRSQAAINHIKNTASKAVGHKNNPGIFIAPHSASPIRYSFRTDINNTPFDYSDDRWTIYLLNAFNKSSIYYCYQDNVAGTEYEPDLSVGADCAQDNVTLLLPNVDPGATRTYLKHQPDDPSSGNFVEIKLTTFLGQLTAPNLSNPYTNPYNVMEAKAIPLSHTW